MDTRQLPPPEKVLEKYRTDKDVREFAHHNLFFWRCIHGGLNLVQASPFSFDPYADYWQLTERRVLVSFFANKFRGCYAPAQSMRKLVLRTFTHFDRARQDGVLGDPALAKEHNWPELAEKLSGVAATIPDYEEYRELRRIWKRGQRMYGETIQAELSSFLEEGAAEATPDDFSPALYLRLAFFPYLGLTDLDELLARQRFFYGFYQLFASTNAYTRGGSLGFAPVLQNNPIEELVDYAKKWAEGERPDETGFDVQGKSERKDRSEMMPVVELYGFLNLHKAPYFNRRAEDWYASFKQPEDASRYDALDRIGETTRGFLEGSPAAAEELVGFLEDAVTNPSTEPTLEMEGIRLVSVAKSFPEDARDLAEFKLADELNEAAREKVASMDHLDAAASMYHTMLDAFLYAGSTEVQVPTVSGAKDDPEVPYAVPEGAEAEKIELPDSLAQTANDALGYLRGGFHVLFAGPPGTGKTTLAQIVGHAWNRHLNEVCAVVSLTDAPATTVANSAWAPFHTIGGIVPDGDGGFTSHKGIFIRGEDPEPGVWQLRGDCLVLDEMNRADLDRCIGELYPLLSRSVSAVHPAGIPGVRSVRQHPRCRVIATVNDATLDDIVFPISEGLARRFVRIELSGATEGELKTYLAGLDDRSRKRHAAGMVVIRGLGELLTTAGMITTSERGEHLPFGVGYFSALRAWVREELVLSQEFHELDDVEQARRIVLTSLRGASRRRGIDEILGQLELAELTE